MRHFPLRPSTAIAAAAMAFLSACAPDSTGPTSSSSDAISAQLLAGNSYVVVSDGDLAAVGDFAAYNANNSIRISPAGVSSEFWDNKSADFAGIEKCNIGFYASGVMDPTCINDDGFALNSDAGSVPLLYTKYLADGMPQDDATSFKFSGNHSYTVTLKGSYAGKDSEVGWFTKSAAGVYTFYKVVSWSEGRVGTVETINTGGAEWGFFIRNTFNAAPDGCAPDTHCSDAEGGFSGDFNAPNQQFAMFSNTGGTAFLVGAEDNLLELMPNGQFLDSDYNDYIWSVVPTVVPRGCDFMTFGRTQIEAGGQSVVISGNAGGNSPQGGILGNFLVKVNDTQYNLQEIVSYGPIPADQLFGNLPNARVIVGRTSDNTLVEIRIYDGGEPGSGVDQVYVKIGTGPSAPTPLGASGTSLNRGNIQFHAQCRGPR